MAFALREMAFALRAKAFARNEMAFVLRAEGFARKEMAISPRERPCAPPFAGYRRSDDHNLLKGHSKAMPDNLSLRNGHA
jgi:hypothetical protein